MKSGKRLWMASLRSARVLKKGGAMLVFMSVIKVETLIRIAERHGLYYKTTGIWHKQPNAAEHEFAFCKLHRSLGVFHI